MMEKRPILSGTAFSGRACRRILALAFCAAVAVGGAAAENGEVARGEYLVAAGGCASCHTVRGGEAFAGGAAIRTRFGDFYPPNITPHPERGIGRWSDRDFVRAMREGVRPDGGHYFPAFPYTSYVLLSEADALAMKAYLFSLPAVDRASRPHEIPFPLNWRFLQAIWKLFFFRREGSGSVRSPETDRGAYLVEALAHCGECHTPRNGLGGLERDLWMAGTVDGPDGEAVPNITPDSRTGLTWSVDEIVSYLRMGMNPEGDFAGSVMADVIENGTSRLTDEDLAAIAGYLKSLEPIRNLVGSGS